MRRLVKDGNCNKKEMEVKEYEKMCSSQIARGQYDSGVNRTGSCNSGRGAEREWGSAGSGIFSWIR